MVEWRMTIFRALLALLLASPAFAQVRAVPRIAAPFVSAPALPTLAAPSIGSTLPSLPAAPLLTERAAFELQKDADRLHAALAGVHAREMAGEPRAVLADAKRALAADLKSVLSQIPGEGMDWDSLSDALKELRRERAALEKLDRAAGPDASERAARSGRRAQLNAEILALQMRAAWSQLTGEAPLNAPAFRRNAAMWSLVGAYNSAAAARAESGWREGRDHAEAVFGDGRAVVVSRRWMNAHSELDEAVRDARNGRAKQAAERFARLAELLRKAPAQDAEHLARHRAAAAVLHAAVAAALSGEDGADLTERAAAAKALITHPKLSEPVAVSYGGLGKAARAQVHALESAKAEYLSVLAREAVLARWAQVLAGPRPTKADRAAARIDIAEAQAWAARGFVGPKQLAAQALGASLAALDRGDAALAAKHAGWGRDELSARRTELERIAEGLRRRLARLAGV